MAVVVIGGHTRNIGKTSVVSELIAAMPARAWTAIKITQFGHGVCSANGEPCDCETADHAVAVSEERSSDTGTDTSRYLAAGAARSFWVRTRQGQLHEAMPRVRQLLASAEHCIVESNSLLRFLQPDVFVSVLDPSVADFKASALRYLDRADALVLPEGAEISMAWRQVSGGLVRKARQFVSCPPQYCSAELTEFVATRLDHRPSSAAILPGRTKYEDPLLRSGCRHLRRCSLESVREGRGVLDARTSSQAKGLQPKLEPFLPTGKRV